MARFTTHPRAAAPGTPARLPAARRPRRAAPAGRRPRAPAAARRSATAYSERIRVMSLSLPLRTPHAASLAPRRPVRATASACAGPGPTAAPRPPPSTSRAPAAASGTCQTGCCSRTCTPCTRCTARDSARAEPCACKPERSGQGDCRPTRAAPGTAPAATRAHVHADHAAGDALALGGAGAGVGRLGLAPHERDVRVGALAPNKLGRHHQVGVVQNGALLARSHARKRRRGAHKRVGVDCSKL